MGPPPVTFVLVILILTATLPGPMVHAERSSAPDEDTPTSNMTRADNQCSPMQRRQDLLDKRVNGLDNSLNAQLTERDTDINTRLNGLNEADTHLNSRLNGVDARLNRIDSRFDELEAMMSDMKEYLRQRMDAMEGTTPTGKVDSHDTPPTRTSQIPKDCQEAYTMGSTSSGVYRIAPEPNTPIDVFCEQELDGGGWTVFQLRKDGTINFFLDWNAYKQGFGQLTGEFWLGNTNIHCITKHHDQQLKIELTSPEGEIKYADYSHFWITDEADKYRLNVEGYSGGSPPGDSLTGQNTFTFSTKDKDATGFCATSRAGAWWYEVFGASSLNGQYGATGRYNGLIWSNWKGYNVSLKGSRMMMRKRP